LEGWEIPNAPTSIPNLKSARSAAASDLVNAQVESVNIVGYTTTTGANGATMYAPMFTAVGGGAITLGDIKGDFEEYVDTIQILDENLVGTTLYNWVDIGRGPVWTSDFATDDSAVTIPIGHSVVISTSGSQIQNAGEVKLTPTVVTCGTGATTLGNPLPKPITLGSIIFTGLEEYVDTIQILDENLVGTTLYNWVDLGGGPVWTSDFATDDSSTVFEAGVGFVLSSQNGCTVTFPAAL
jgi:hypothetical protein